MHDLRGCEVNQFNIAQDFQEAYKRCIHENKKNNILAIPAFTNGFFACELYLKILSNNKIKGHNLSKLFNSLSEEYKNELKKHYNPVNLFTPSLDEMLEKISFGFEFWRYIYEENNKDFEKDHPFSYSEKFLAEYLSLLEEMAKKHNSN